MKTINTTVSNAVFQWIGGKWEHAEWIISNFPDHHVYVEVCGGAGSVLLRKQPSKVEVYNDIDRTIANFFWHCRNNTDNLAKLLALTEYSHSIFNECCGLIKLYERQDKVQSLRAAWALAVVARMSMSGRLGGSWSRSLGHRRAGISSSVARWLLLPDTIIEVASRLREVQIENMSATNVIIDYDKQDTLFYIDPPYVPSTRSPKLYRHEMTIEQHAELLETCLAAQGRFVISGYPNSLYDEKLAKWKRIDREVACRSNVTAKGIVANRPTRIEVLWIKE